MSKSFTIITSKPSKSDKYIYLYNNSKNGGKSRCICGKPLDNTCNVLCNCVGWACARFNHIYNLLTGFDGIKYPNFCCNAEKFIEVAEKYDLEIGDTPRPGAIMVWKKGTLSSADGAGHVAIVEEVISDSKVLTSESGYNSFDFANKTRNNANGNWGVSGTYTFRGFIYNPAVDDKTESKKSTCDIKIVKAEKRNKSVNQIQVLVSSLRVRSDHSTSGAILGYATLNGYYNYTDVYTSCGYTWYKIGPDNWVANSNGWISKLPAECLQLNIGDKVKISPDATIYNKNSRFASWVYKSDLYVRAICNDKITISIYKTGATTGSVDKKYIVKC